ncbi:MAG: hypothetical protein IJ004_00405 [Clostridia bacterium]|nr:hypothetical protein [Clostridia bacterium]
MDNNEKNQASENMQEPNESNIARRERLLGTDMTDKIHDDKAEITKGNFFANVWYRFKWAIIVVALFLVVMIYGLVHSALQKTYDLDLSYFGPVYVKSSLHDDIQKMLSDLAQDYNGDGEKKINFTFTTYQGEEGIENIPENQEFYNAILTANANTEALKGMNSQINSGHISFYIMDKDIYEMYKGHFITVEEILGYKLDSSKLYDSRAVLLEETMLDDRYPTLAPICKDSVICVQKIYTTSEEKLESAKALFKAIVELE